MTSHTADNSDRSSTSAAEIMDYTSLHVLVGKAKEHVQDVVYMAPWWNHPVFYFMTISMHPLIHIVCWLYHMLQILLHPMLTVPAVEYLASASSWSLGTWIVVLCDFLLGHFMLNVIIGLAVVPLVELIIPSKLEWFPRCVAQKQQQYQKQQQQQEQSRSSVNAGKQDPKQHQKRVYSYVLYWFCALESINFVASVLLSRSVLQPWSVRLFAQFFSLGICSAISVTVSHELFHKVGSPVESFLGKMLLTMHMYTHFWITHVFNHHKDVATPNDPATALEGQTLYAFVVRSSLGGYIKAWEIEYARLRRICTDNVWLKLVNPLQSRMAKYALLCCAMQFATYVIGGWSMFTAYWFHCLVATLFMEAVNYIEHYGLARRKLPNGRYEPVTDAHSWDAPFRLSSFTFLNILLHSDHHAHPLKDYNDLSLKLDSPKLPYTYGTMILLSLFPPLFNSVIEPHLRNAKRLALQQQNRSSRT